MKKFSKLRIKQLWDDARIFAAWLASIRKGKVLRDRKTGRPLTAKEVINRFARTRGLLWALGYPLKVPGPNTTLAFKILFKRALPGVRKWYNFYKRRVQRSSE